MITYRLSIAMIGREQPLTIYADHRVINEANEVEFYDAADTLIATVPAAIIIDLVEA